VSAIREAKKEAFREGRKQIAKIASAMSQKPPKVFNRCHAQLSRILKLRVKTGPSA
jgi:hypothetical protein